MSVEKVLPFPFYCKPRQSAVSLKIPGLENIPQVPGNRGVVCQNHDSHKAVSATLSVLNWSGAIFRLRSPKGSVEKVLPFPFYCKPRQSAVSLKIPGLENIPQVPGNRAEVGQKHDARKAGSAPLSVLKWSSKVNVQKICCVHFTASQAHQELV